MNTELIEKIEKEYFSCLLRESMSFEQTIDSFTENDFLNSNISKIFSVIKNHYKSNISTDIKYLKCSLLKDDKLMDELSYLETMEYKKTPDDYFKFLKENSNNRNFELDCLKILKKSGQDITSIKKMIDSAFDKRNIKKESIFKRVNIGDIKNTKPSFLLNDFMPIEENEINIISGDGGIGKSCLGLLLLLLIVKENGKKCFGWFSEDTLGESKSRLLQLASMYHATIEKIEIMGKENITDYFTRKAFGVMEETEYFRLFKEEFKDYDVILLDPASSFQGGDENDNADVKFFMNILNKYCEEYKKTIILIHHNTKATEKKKGVIRGAGSFVQSARIHYAAQESSRTNCINVSLEKANHISKKMEHKEIEIFENIENSVVQSETTKKVNNKTIQNETRIIKKNESLNNTFTITIEEDEKLFSASDEKQLAELKNKGIKFEQ